MFMNKRWRLKSEHRTLLFLWVSLFSIHPVLTSYLLTPNAIAAATHPIDMALGYSWDLCWFCYPVAGLSGIVALFARYRTAFAKVLLCSIVAGTAISMGTLVSLRTLENFSETLDFGTNSLVSAIVDFQKKEGHPPATLSELVPTYLSRIPDPGIGGSPGFEYQLLDDSDQLLWRLKLPCPVDTIFDCRCFYVCECPKPSALERDVLLSDSPCLYWKLRLIPVTAPQVVL